MAVALCDAGDKAVLLRPYYFNHLMAMQMTGVTPLMAPRDSQTFIPDMAWLEDNLAGAKVT